MADLGGVTLMNAELRWPYLAEPQTKGEYASNKYQVDVVFGEDYLETINKLKNNRQLVKDIGDGKYLITLKSSKKPKVQDAKKNIMDDESLKALGNGTIAHVKATQYKGYKDQVFLGLRAIMVTDFHKYEGGDEFADIEAVADDDAAPFDTDDDDII